MLATLIDIIQNGGLITIKSNNSCCTKHIFKLLEKQPSIPFISNYPKIVKTGSKKESSSESCLSDCSSGSLEEHNIATINNEKKNLPNKKNDFTSFSSEVDSLDESELGLKSNAKDLKNNNSHSVCVKSEDPLTNNVNEASFSGGSSSSDDKIIKKMDHQDIQEKEKYLFLSGYLHKNGPNVSYDYAMLLEHEEQEFVSKLGLRQLVNVGYTVLGRRKSRINSDSQINNNNKIVEELQSLTVPS
ncbi:unnamed protein product [Lepeophtheirus salmonis]|uniref:(salmon louse) hypothetical protein n=1 Tax=Lepeophtheirus salmonis TaxID=72036 RepID=A0A7R8D1A0_LEPSM|nr:unnamed protein product [Lepeophtheirus salmonis]CAF2992917.1 unnamed protein product [Lepeophtheirus salmonis]